MIDSQKLKEISKLSGLRPWQQEKHYLQSIMLSIVSDFPLVFKGGTYLWLFHGLNRFSEDLDFTATGSIKDDVSDYISRSLRLYGFRNEVKVFKNDNLGLSTRFMINGPLNTNDRDRCVIYVEISKRESALLPKVPLKLDLPQYDIPVKRILGMNLNEVSAEKTRAILTREKGRDIYDLYFLVHRKGVVFDKELINKKLDFYKIEFNSESFLEKLRGREKRYLRELKSIILGDLPAFDIVCDELEKWIQS
ncbi:MAG: nucleotidyl transferase AbiEii/AbiGii toxin family protein [Thermoplasmataceae archaeon]